MLPKGTPIITIPKQEIRNIEEKAKLRQAYREFFIKEKSNPFRHAAANGTGYIEDPGFVRYEVSQSFMSRYTHQKVTPRSTRIFFAVIVAPILLLGYFGTTTRAAFDQKCRQGEIAYADRMNKFV